MNSTYKFWETITLIRLLPLAMPSHPWRGSALMAIDPEGDLLIIKRSETVPSHRGQLALPGGHPQNQEMPAETALREFYEETGLANSQIMILGQLPLVPTARGEAIIPVVAKTDFLWKKQKLSIHREWTAALVVSMPKLLEENSWTQGAKQGPSGNHPLYFRSISINEIHLCGGSLPKETFPNPLLLWGATAQMLISFRQMTLKSAN